MAKPTTKPMKNRKGVVPSTAKDTVTVGNNIKKIASGEYKPLNFKIDAEFSREFRTFAASHDMKLIELLRECFDLYKEHKTGA